VIAADFKFGQVVTRINRTQVLREHVPACAQVLQHADVAFFFGMIDTQQRIDAMTMQLLISQLIADGANTLDPN
jgi:hypothetical protein